MFMHMCAVDRRMCIAKVRTLRFICITLSLYYLYYLSSTFYSSFYFFLYVHIQVCVYYICVYECMCVCVCDWCGL
ncbi:hypothetical protein BDF19DRAFT_57975 [Syncephalis fuscata]|nr:hypothetical protein BDF19DRAFT_57975 [Syncephalis fuscata]